MGDYATAEREYKKVYWGKLKRQHRLRDELNWRRSMLKNYLTVALRNLLRQKGYSFINVAGLTVGLASFILIALFVQHELSYDRFHEKADRIYRIVQRQPGNVYLGTDYFAVTPAVLASTLLKEYPEVKQATAFREQEALLSLGEQNTWEKGLLADEHFLEVFTFPLLRGEPKTALAQPNSLVLTETLARKLFGAEDPVGRTLRYQQEEDAYTVTGIVADPPDNSSIRFTFIASASSNEYYLFDLGENAWQNNSWNTFVVLAEGSTGAGFQAQMPGLVKKYVAREDYDPVKSSQYIVQPLRDLHLRSRYNFGIRGQGNITYVYLFSAIGLVILLLACVNYTNLAVARSVGRSREVGMRKVVGAWRRQLVAQFLGESVLMASLALVLAIGLVYALAPFFGRLVERPIQLDFVGNGLLLPGLLLLVVLVGLLSGSYPAFFMASLRPIQVLMGKGDSRTSKFRVQRLLIVGQYAASIALVACSFVVYQQLRYVQHKELGYNREHVVTVPVRDGGVRENYAVIREAWLRDPHVVAVTSSTDLPTNVQNSQIISGWDGSSEDESLPIYRLDVGHDFLKVFGIELAAGRSFKREAATDGESGYLINETAARAMGWTPEEAIGKHFVHEEEVRTVIGVVRDFHMHSMHLAIQPLLILLNPDRIWNISAKVRPENLPGTIALFERTVKQFTPYPFEYRFLDDQFDELYKKEVRLGETFGFFTALALLIASLGLFGLAAFAAQQRTKEIGVRKVLGASVPGIITLLSMDFLKLVGLAFVVAAPVAYFLMHRWLEGFAYRIELGPGVFLLTGGLVVLIAVLTVSYQSVKAALGDPVKSLRYE